MTPAPQPTRLARAFAVWLVLIVAEILHGIARGIFLVPHVGEFRSNQIGVFTGSIIILVIALVFVRWIGVSRTTDLLAVGVLWLILTLAFEFLRPLRGGGVVGGWPPRSCPAVSWGPRGRGWPPTTTCWKAGCCRSGCWS